jgi:hypothetical protein
VSAAPITGRRGVLVAPWATTATISFAVAVVLLGGTLAASDRPTRAVVWGGLALAAYSAGFMCLVERRQRAGRALARWQFGPWVLLWYGATFGLATVTWSGPQTGTPAQIAISSVLRGLWLVAVGMTALAIGYFVGPGQSARGIAARRVAALSQRFTADVRSGAAPWILYAVGLIARLASTVTTGQFGYVGEASSAVSSATGYGQILAVLSLCCPLAVAAAAIQLYRERLRGARITLIILFLAELGFGAAAGGKESFVIAVLAIVIPRSAARQRLPKAALVGVALAFLIIVIPFNEAYRSVARSGSITLTPRQAVAAAPGILRQTVTGHQIVTVLPDSVDYLFQRTREIDNPAIIVQRTPGQIPFLSSADLITAPVADIIPRAIWPTKPIMATGYQFSQQYYGLSSTLYTSSAITPIGDLYRHGGWIPVIAGMFLLGCGVRLLDAVLDVRANPHAIFLVMLFFPSLVAGEQDWITLVASIPGTLLIWVLAVALTFRTRRPT